MKIKMLDKTLKICSNKKFCNEDIYVQIPDEYLKPEGTLDITDMNEFDVTEYAKAQIKDENLKAENIAEGVEVLGITGTMKGAGSSEDTLVALLEGTLEGTVTSNNCTTLKPYFFQGLSGLKEVNLPNVTTLSSTGYQFNNCTALEKVTLGNVTSIPSRCFVNCKALKTIYLPEVTTLSSYSFANCSSLTTINAPKITTIGEDCFYGCSELLEADFPNATSLGYDAFYNCYKLKSVNLPNVTSTYLSYTFNNCRELETVNIPQVKYLSTSAFSGCDKLKKIILQNVQSVDEFSLGYCNELSVVCLPNLRSINSSYSFYKDYSLTHLIITQEDTICTLSSSSTFSNGCYHFTGTKYDPYNPNGDKDGYIYVPDSLVEQYKSATNWSKWADQIKGLSELSQDIKEEFGI